MKKCNCANFKQLIEKEGHVGEVQDWNWCTFCGKKMKEEAEGK